jgi:hypothetical protein
MPRVTRVDGGATLVVSIEPPLFGPGLRGVTAPAGAISFDILNDIPYNPYCPVLIGR